MIRKLPLFALSLFLFASCNKTTDDKVVIREEKINPYFTGIDLSDTSIINWKRIDPTEKYFMLGYGYDITGKYAHPAFTRNKVIDIEALHNDNGRISSGFVSMGGPELEISGTREECIRTMGERAGLSSDEIAKYKHIFKETFESSFKNDTTFKSLTYHYEGVSQVILFAFFEIYDLNFVETEYKYVTAQFKKDLETKTATEIISLYGTHVLKRIKVGQRMDYLYRNNQQTHTGSWLSPTINKYFIPGPSMWTDKPQDEVPLKENLSIQFIGGSNQNTNSWMIDVTNYTGKKVVSQEWNNFSEKNNTLIDFFRNDGVVPIYNFVKDEKKKQALIEAYNSYLGL
ncbi:MULTISPECIES: hypothetical protein [Sphingobacterium]|jgi:hypothetical protein|uniref:hypothetical protein n=1 Tax=Sphingobacterium TaxID=28453 RepID=UPI0010509248|nr:MULTISPECIES: hypothetical protein [Sphingobacterium]MCW2259345.1 hypothetical protein [Sphingobacterium kitahiroshimense]TCR14207.1 hypothetical protein EDF67_101310 [Sphingobacterium sp. JUb78]